MKKLIVLILCTVALGAGLYCLYKYTRTRCVRHACLSFALLDSAKIETVFEDSKDAYRAMYTTPKGQLRLSKHMGLSETDAKDLTQITEMKISGLFDNALSPYPGPLSSKIVCDEKYKPIPQIYSSNTTQITTFAAYLNNRLQYGSCIDNQVTHKSYNAIFYCANERAWYQVELIIPLSNIKPDEAYFTLLHSISCKHAPALF